MRKACIYEDEIMISPLGKLKYVTLREFHIKFGKVLFGEVREA